MKGREGAIEGKGGKGREKDGATCDGAGAVTCLWERGRRTLGRRTGGIGKGGGGGGLGLKGNV